MDSTRRRFVLILLATGVFSFGTVATAHADVTGFVGGMTSTSGGMGGGAFGKCFTRACWELEYARAHGGSPTDEGSFETVGFNILVPFKSPIHRVKFYGLAGLGMYCQMFGEASGPGSANSLGGGVLLALGGSLTFRLDHRVVLLGQGDEGSQPVASRIQRVTTGLGVRF